MTAVLSEFVRSFPSYDAAGQVIGEKYAPTYRRVNGGAEYDLKNFCMAIAHECRLADYSAIVEALLEETGRARPPMGNPLDVERDLSVEIGELAEGIAVFNGSLAHKQLDRETLAQVDEEAEKLIAHLEQLRRDVKARQQTTRVAR